MQSYLWHLIVLHAICSVLEIRISVSCGWLGVICMFIMNCCIRKLICDISLFYMLYALFWKLGFLWEFKKTCWVLLFWIIHMWKLDFVEYSCVLFCFLLLRTIWCFLAKVLYWRWKWCCIFVFWDKLIFLLTFCRMNSFCFGFVGAICKLVFCWNEIVRHCICIMSCVLFGLVWCNIQTK